MKSVIKKLMLVASGIICLVLLLSISTFAFLNQKSFGRLPSGERLERIRRSPHFYDGEFHNLHPTALMTASKKRSEAMWDFLFSKPDGLIPNKPIPAVKTDLKTLDKGVDCIVWFGHSSYLLQLSGRRILVDPVFCMASPVSFVNKPFKGTDIYRPEDMPDMDYLVITHDHWDHLDYNTVKKLKDRVGKVIVPLGVGEDFEYWGYDKRSIIELDWREDAVPEEGFVFHCLPARHFSGRGLTRNHTLWASFLVETPSLNVYMAGDGGYDTHFKEIGEKFPTIDLAILENGQYNDSWKYIHTLPHYLGREALDLGAKQVMTVHHSKYALARHPWDDPLKNELAAAKEDSLHLIVTQIGAIVKLQ